MHIGWVEAALLTLKPYKAGRLDELISSLLIENVYVFARSLTIHPKLSAIGKTASTVKRCSCPSYPPEGGDTTGKGSYGNCWQQLEFTDNFY